MVHRWRTSFGRLAAIRSHRTGLGGWKKRARALGDGIRNTLLRRRGWLRASGDSGAARPREDGNKGKAHRWTEGDAHKRDAAGPSVGVTEVTEGDRGAWRVLVVVRAGIAPRRMNTRRASDLRSSIVFVRGRGHATVYSRRIGGVATV